MWKDRLKAAMFRRGLNIHKHTVEPRDGEKREKRAVDVRGRARPRVSGRFADQAGAHRIEVHVKQRRLEPVRFSLFSQGTAVNFTAQGSDVCDPSPLIECPGSGDIFAVGTTTTANCSITDQSANQAQCSFNVKVLSQAELVQSLLDRVGAIGAGGGVNPGVVEGLRARLTNSLRMLQSGGQTATCTQLDSFIRNVRNDGAQGRLTPAQADSLALSAMNLRAALACN